MLNFEYEIRLNDDLRPFVYIPDTYIDKPEDKFMALELTRYMLVNLLNLRSTSLPENEVRALESAQNTLEVLSDELALKLKELMENLGNTEITMTRNYHVICNTRDERDKLNYEGFIYNGKIFKRMIGLKVLVYEDMNVYELVDGIDNNNWQRI